MKEVLIVTTEGCEGCKIAVNLTKQAIEKSNIDNISLKTIDCLNKYYNQIIKENNITDFPTTILIKNNSIVCVYSGTLPVNSITKKLNFWFS